LHAQRCAIPNNGVHVAALVFNSFKGKPAHTAVVLDAPAYEALLLRASPLVALGEATFKQGKEL
jgi:hypothetical protein